MSIFGTLNTAVSGMAAQASKLGTIGDNIANANTVGYKSADTEFETFLGSQSNSEYNSGGVQTRVRYGIADQGSITTTASVTDLAISGNGFFLVQDANGSNVLTRAGSFVPNATGNLVNTAGYKLMGYNLTDGSSATANGTGGLQVIDLSKQALSASPSKTGTLSVNLPSNAPVATADLPSANAASSAATEKTSLVAYDDLGNQVTLDVYMTKTGVDASGNNQWEVAVYNKADAAAGGGFPYTSPMLGSSSLTFDKTTGKLTAGSTSAVPISIPNGETVSLNMGLATQLAADYTVASATIDGTAPSKLDHITIGNDGTVTSVYANGVQSATYRIPLAAVESPDNLTALSGNVYQVSLASGTMTVGTAGTGTLGIIKSDSLESSTVDLATELTSMISAQRGYEANSKVLQTGSDLLSVLTNLHT